MSGLRRGALANTICLPQWLIWIGCAAAGWWATSVGAPLVAVSGRVWQLNPPPCLQPRDGDVDDNWAGRAYTTTSYYARAGRNLTPPKLMQYQEQVLANMNIGQVVMLDNWRWRCNAR